MRVSSPGRGRVVESHDIARSAFLWAGGFALVAVVWSVYVLVAGGSWWGPLHTFLAGTVLLAIAGASQMFTITWSSTIPPSRTMVLAQRWLLIGGVGTVLVGISRDLPAFVWVGGMASAVGVALLAGVISASVRRSLLRRFDLSARFYIVAFASGIVGITLGTIMGAGVAGDAYPAIRMVHAHLNLVGLVGLTIIGTIPTLLPTTAHSPGTSGSEAVVAWWLALAGVVSIAVGLWLDVMVGIGTLAVAVSGLLILARILYQLWEKGRHQLPFLQISAGTTWLIGWAIADGIRMLSSGTMPAFSGWTAAAAVAGVAQVLAGSLAYLLPVLAGSPFSANRQIMEGRRWLPLVVLNTAGVFLGAGVNAVVVVLMALWVADFGTRLARMARSRRQRRSGQMSIGS